MTEQAWWVVALVAVVITGVIGFFIGRQTASSKERVDELEEALSREKAALADYRDKVDAHFDRTAGLFVSMAGSYKDLFEHLSSGYQDLAPGASRELFKDRVSALLLESREPEVTPVGTVVADAGEPVSGEPASPSPEPDTRAGEPGPAPAEVTPEATDAPGLTLAKAESVTPESSADLDTGVAEAARPAEGSAEDNAANPQAPETVVPAGASLPESAAATGEPTKTSP